MSVRLNSLLEQTFLNQRSERSFLHLLTQYGIYAVSYWLFIQRPAGRVMDLSQRPVDQGKNGGKIAEIPTVGFHNSSQIKP